MNQYQENPMSDTRIRTGGIKGEHFTKEVVLDALRKAQQGE